MRVNKKKLLQRFRKIVLTILVIWFASDLYTRLAPVYISGLGGQWQKRIPQEIVFLRDCQKYREFIHAIAKPLPNDACPWAKLDLNKPAELQLGENIYKIPRDYLWINKEIRNGKVVSIHLMMKYPDMTPGLMSEFDGESGDKFVKVMMQDFSQYKGDLKVKEREWYYNVSFLGHCLKGKKQYCPTKVAKIDALDIIEYATYHQDNKNIIIDNFFIKGDIFNPEYWMMCNIFRKIPTENNPRCETARYLLEDKIKVSLSFRRRGLFNEQREVVDKVLAKINQFKVTANDNSE